VIEISIVRPGPITGGMVHPYLRRRRGEEPVDYPHESLRPVLEKTLGIPLFQEQVMKLAVVAADYTPGEADQLRRDMAAWRHTGRIEKHHERLVSRMVAKGIAPEFAERVFAQIRGFGEYGFPESHAASFALISYAASYLKRHYPAEFACALLNAQPMGFYAPSTIVEDARHHGVTVLPVDVHASDWECQIGDSDRKSVSQPNRGQLSPNSSTHRLTVAVPEIRLGLSCVKGLGEGEGERIVAARRAAGRFASLRDFVRAVRLDRGSLAALAEAGAFESLGLARREALWELKRLARRQDDTLPLADLPARQGTLFAPLDPAETVAWDYRATDLSPRGHPVEAVRAQLRAQGLPDARTVAALPNGRRVRYAGAVICRQRPGTARGTVFLTMEDETGFVNVVLWGSVYERYALTVKTHPLLGIAGKIEAHQGVSHLIAESVFVPRLARPVPDKGSRDFH